MKLKIIIVVVMIVTFCTCLGTGFERKEIVFRDEDYHAIEDNICTSPIGSSGKCVDIRVCPILLALISKPDKHEFLRQSLCGWNQTTPKVCCNANWNCTAAGSYPGCVSEKIDSCRTSLPSNEQVNAAAEATTEELHCEMSTVLPDPSLYCCGRGVSTNKITGGEATLIDKYPWAAVIEYVLNDFITVKCGGSLISGTYVLTAAHCLFVKAWKPFNVRLGDYDIDHPGIDCIKIECGEDCTDEPVTIPIEEMIQHPDYVYGPRMQSNDIALIRMKYMAPYTGFIRPICLPTSHLEDTSFKIGLKVVGWGAVDEIRSYTSAKHHVTLPFDCFNVYRRLNISLGEGQICAGGEAGKDSCKGDSGGALMLVKEQMTEIVGITSFGYTPCGTKNMPAVYTKVYHYLPWIRSIIY